MSIEVKGVSKLYGSQKALDDVSFSVGKGEIIGFLGPNGAGKSTMMKIITCYIPPSHGEVKVAGYSVNDAAMDVRKRVGYLPEHNPLYLDMYVREFLDFIAGIHKVSSSRVEEMIKRTGLTPEKHKKIGALSKGYRQRVGLAQSMIHDPEVLILDEPTTGLDPNQIVEIRDLIREIGEEKTVMLSTHIMQEVEAICDRVIIINKGKIAADRSTDEIQQSNAKAQVLRLECEGSLEVEDLRQSIKASATRKIKNGLVLIESTSGKDLRKDLFNYAVAHDITILQLSRDEKNLEQVFQELTMDPN